MLNPNKKDPNARVMSDSYYSAAELYIIFLKRSKWGSAMKGSYWSSLSLISSPPFFFSLPVSGKARGWERRQLWEGLPLNKNGETQGTKVRCCMNNSCRCCCCSPDLMRSGPPAADLPPSETLRPPNCRHLMRAQNYWIPVESTWGTQRDAPAPPESSLKSFLDSRPPGWMPCETGIDFQDEDIELHLARGSNSYQSDGAHRF